MKIYLLLYDDQGDSYDVDGITASVEVAKAWIRSSLSGMHAVLVGELSTTVADSVDMDLIYYKEESAL
jgi:hypothetical protein